MSESVPKHEVDEDLLKPLWIARTIATRPCAVYWVTFVIMIILSIIDGQVFSLDLEQNERTFLIEGNKYTDWWDAWTLAQEDNDNVDDGEDEDTVELPQTEQAGLWSVFFMFEMEDYHSDDNNFILTPSYLETIISYEDMVLKDDRWPDYYCYIPYDTDTYECSQEKNSYFSLAYKIYDHYNGSYDSMTTEDIISYVWELHKDEQFEALIEASLGAGWVDNNKSEYYRDFLNAGGPIPSEISYNNGTVTKISDFKNIDDEYDEQEEMYNDDFALDLWEDITVKYEAGKSDNDLRVAVLIYSCWVEFIWAIFNESVSFVFLALMSVLVWMTFHLQSIFLSCLGVTGILLSFPFAYFIYYFIYGVTYFDFLSSLIIFVLLGVGADDVFVFTDAWHQSVHFVKNPDDDVERMTFAYRRASKAMFVTQVTTFFAFLATAFSRLKPIAAFGYWASLIVAADYILVITMYPSVLMIHHRYIKKFESKYLCCCCYGGCKRDKPELSTKAHTEEEISKEIQMANTKTAAGDTNNTTTGQMDDTTANDDGPPPGLTRTRSVEEQADEYRAIERFCGIKWTGIIQKIKFPVLLAFAIIFGISVWLMVTGLEPLEEAEGIFTSDHYMQQILDFATEFGVSEDDGLSSVTVVWGVKGVNRAGSEAWDFDDFGKVQWDDDFDMSSPEAQLYLYHTCNNLSESDIVYSRELTECPLNSLVNYTNMLNVSFPWVYMDPSDASYDPAEQKIAFAEFVYDFSISQYADDTFDYVYVQSPSESDDGNYYIRYYAVFANIDLTFQSSRGDAIDRRDAWNEWLDETFWETDDCPDSVCDPISVSSTWTWLISQDWMVRSAVQGIAIALPIAFVVLILSTRNWIVAIFATIDILGVMACGLAVISLAGWQFGTTESISIVLIIGFSVDYVVHLANAYLECQDDTREERLGFSLLTMGVSVGSGAVTTFLAGLFLLFPSFLFFYKMGVMLLATIIWSIVWAMLFFTSLLAAAGPQGQTGHIPIEKMIEKCKKMRE